MTLPPDVAAAVAAYDILIESARAAGARADADALIRLGREAQARRCQLARRYPWSFSPLTNRDAGLDDLYDAAFPKPTRAGDPFDELADWLALPWPSNARLDAFDTAIVRATGGGTQLSDLAETVLAQPRSPRRVALLRGMLETPFRQWRDMHRVYAARVVAALHAAGGLDASLLEMAFDYDTYLADELLGHADQRAGEWRPGVADPACAAVVREVVDELAWRLTEDPTEDGWEAVPGTPVRGLRFVLRGLDIAGGRPPCAPPRSDTAPYAGSLMRHLLTAELTSAETAELPRVLAGRSVQERRLALVVRLPAPDSPLAPLGLASAGPVLALMRARPERQWGEHPQSWDRTEIRAAVDAAGEDTTRQLLAVIAETKVGADPGALPELHEQAEVIAATYGWNRSVVRTRVKRSALNAIVAFGMLPLGDGESVVDRYLALREVAKKAAKFGPSRRLSHAAAVDVALTHLAQVTGYPDAGRLEWDSEVHIAAETAQLQWSTGEYEIALRQDGVDVVLALSKVGRILKSVPSPLRKDPAYIDARAHQERLREQVRRVRTGLIEPLVAKAGVLAPGELARLMAVPAAAAMLPGLLWRDGRGEFGLLDEAASQLSRVDRTTTPVDGPLTAAHPWHLYDAEQLGAWQREVVRRRLRQPVKQVFRELYLLTPPERQSGTESLRFAGHRVDGAVAVKLLSSRGWSIHAAHTDAHTDAQATRTVDGVRAGVEFVGLSRYLGGGTATTGTVSFHRGEQTVPLPDVPEVFFSEAMRDLDLVVSVAAIDGYDVTSPGLTARREILTALLADLALPGIIVDGQFARVAGTRANYRVHLGSGTIHVEPGGHLCVVPAEFGRRPHDRLFLPFADDDAMTSVVLSKVLMLADDDKITDESILAQL